MFLKQYRESIHAVGNLRVQPIGLAAAAWDDTGHAEWLTSDSPLVAVTADHELREMVLNLVGPTPSRLEVSDDEISGPFFVELGFLAPGKYKLHVITQVKAQKTNATIGTLSFTIRHPRGSQNTPSIANPFRVLVSPAAPSRSQSRNSAACVGG